MKFLTCNNIQKQPPRGVPRKGDLKICTKFTGEHPCRSANVFRPQNIYTENSSNEKCLSSFPNYDLIGLTKTCYHQAHQEKRKDTQYIKN